MKQKRHRVGLPPSSYLLPSTDTPTCTPRSPSRGRGSIRVGTHQDRGRGQLDFESRGPVPPHTHIPPSFPHVCHTRVVVSSSWVTNVRVPNPTPKFRTEGLNTETPGRTRLRGVDSLPRFSWTTRKKIQVRTFVGFFNTRTLWNIYISRRSRHPYTGK